jgi:hypothetical protein
MTYTINRDGKQIGTYSLDEVRRFAQEGRLLSTDFAWVNEEQRSARVSELLGIPAYQFHASAAQPAPAPVKGADEETALNAFVGPKYATYYRGKWAAILANKRAWNWAIFFAGPFWLAYRKMYAYAWGYLGLCILSDAIEHALHISDAATRFVFLGISIAMAQGGNDWYRRWTAKRISELGAHDVAELARKGGTSSGAVWLIVAGFVAYIAVEVALQQ